MRTARLAAVVGVAGAASACMSGPRLGVPHMTLPAFDVGPAAAYNGVCHGAACKPGYDATHSQYFDERRRRYYYFDPVRKQYFWANGEPKT